LSLFDDGTGDNCAIAQGDWATHSPLPWAVGPDHRLESEIRMMELLRLIGNFFDLEKFRKIKSN
jgi:hypothetical protein